MKDFLFIFFCSFFGLILSFPLFDYEERACYRYDYSVFHEKKSLVNKFILWGFDETKKKKRKYYYYWKQYNKVFLLLLILYSAIIYFSNLYQIDLVLDIYMISTGVLLIMPEYVAAIMHTIVIFKIWLYNKRKGIVAVKQHDIFRFIKQDKIFSQNKKIFEKRDIVWTAIQPYICVTNPKKKKSYVSQDNIEKITHLLESEFPYAYTKETLDVNNKKIFSVYIKIEDENILILTVPVMAKK